MKYKLLVILISICTILKSQNFEIDKAKSFKFGFGPSFLGYNGKIAIYSSKPVALVVNFERQYFLADAFEVGLGFRKYYGTNNHKLFIQPNISYSTYQPWNWNSPPLSLEDYKIEKTTKLSLLGGLELSINRNLNIDLEVGYGYYTKLEFGRPIARVSFNYIIYKKKRN